MTGDAYLIPDPQKPRLRETERQKSYDSSSQNKDTGGILDITGMRFTEITIT